MNFPVVPLDLNITHFLIISFDDIITLIIILYITKLNKVKECTKNIKTYITIFSKNDEFMQDMMHLCISNFQAGQRTSYENQIYSTYFYKNLIDQPRLGHFIF